MLERISAVIFNCREALVKLEELRDKIKEDNKLRDKNQEIRLMKMRSLKIEQQTITIAERYIIFHDAIVKLEGMVKEK